MKGRHLIPRLAVLMPLLVGLHTVGSHQLRAGNGPQQATQEDTAMEPSAAFNFTPHYAEVHGSRMHYVEAGEGDPVLFIHGQPTWSYLWRNIIPYAAAGHRAIAVDLIGMGKSDKPDLEYTYADHMRYLDGFIDALGLKNVTLVVHDWGSVLGFDYAMRHETNVRGLAFLEALIPPAFPLSGYDALPAPAQEMFRGFRDPVRGRELLIDQNVFIEQMLPGMVLRKLSEEEMEAYREPFRDPSARLPIYRWPNELPIGGVPESTDRLIREIGGWLKETKLPKLHLYAKPGAANPPELAAWTAQNLKNIETAFVGAGVHFIQEDQPEAIGRELADWLRRQDQDQAAAIAASASGTPGYAVVSFDVQDPAAYTRYKELAGPTMAAHGGRLLARTGQPRHLEGPETLPNWVIIEFPSADEAVKWYRSQEYQEAKAAREGAGPMHITVVNGN